MMTPEQPASATDDSYRPPEPDQRANERQQLELEGLRIANRRAERELASFGQPTRWEQIKSAVGFFGVLVPVIISVFTYLGQRQAEIDQRQMEAIQQARKMIESGDRSAGVLQLSTFGAQAIPYLLGEVRVNNFHIDWPSPSLAALAGLKRIGRSRLSDTDKDYLKQQGNLALEQLSDFESGPSASNAKEIVGRLAIVKAIASITGDDNGWQQRISKAEVLLSSWRRRTTEHYVHGQ